MPGANQTGIFSPWPRTRRQAKSPKVPAGPAAPGLVAGLVWWGAQQGHQEGFVIPEHSQIPVDSSSQELPCSPSRRL